MLLSGLKVELSVCARLLIFACLKGTRPSSCILWAGWWPPRLEELCHWLGSPAHHEPHQHAARGSAALPCWAKLRITLGMRSEGLGCGHTAQLGKARLPISHQATKTHSRINDFIRH